MLICSLTVYHSMPDDLSEEQERLSARVNVASVKSVLRKEGLAHQENLLAAKKEVVSKQMQRCDPHTSSRIAMMISCYNYR